MHTSLLLFLFTNLVIGSPLSLNQRDNSEAISRRADTYTFPDIDSLADYSSSNDNNNHELAFSPNPSNNNNNGEFNIPVPPSLKTPIDDAPFSCSPKADSDVVVPGGLPQLQKACCKTTDEQGSTAPKECYGYDQKYEVCADEKHWGCCQDVRNGGSGCTTTVIKGTPPPAGSVVPEVVPGTPAWQNYMRESFVTGWGQVWER